MGTRGLFGFYYRGKFYVCYNHHDSYPEGLGNKLLNQLKTAIVTDTFKDWPGLIAGLKIVNEAVPPTAEEVQRLQNFSVCARDIYIQAMLGSSVTDSHQNDWYTLLRGTQGSFLNVLKCGHILNHVDAAGEPLWEEYAYIVNFEQSCFDIYEGPVKIYEYPFDELPVTLALDDSDSDDDGYDSY